MDSDSSEFSSLEDRLKSFKYWPLKKGPCCPQKMAEAGFYAIGGKSEPDLAKCYVCHKELDGWERDDDPWSEHRKHAPQCPYVLLNKIPREHTVRDSCTLEIEGAKRFLVLAHEKKMKIIETVRQEIVEELNKIKEDGKENQRRRAARTTQKRSSRKE